MLGILKQLEIKKLNLKLDNLQEEIAFLCQEYDCHRREEVKDMLNQYTKLFFEIEQLKENL